MELFFIWVLLSGLAAYFASTKGRTVLGWFLISLILSPFISLIFLLILPSRGVVTQSLRSKLEEIEKLRQDGVITEEEYVAKRKLIIETN